MVDPKVGWLAASKGDQWAAWLDPVKAVLWEDSLDAILADSLDWMRVGLLAWKMLDSKSVDWFVLLSSGSMLLDVLWGGSLAGELDLLSVAMTAAWLDSPTVCCEVVLTVEL